ncbi:MAG TPA: ABC transporter permease subunit [Candidatus Krumholzibacteria bacterium]|nr:ABC transporter permease subunit [Candidatus Krumholzibacteria bacterium]
MPAIYTLALHTIRTHLQEKILLVVFVFAGLLMVSSYVLSPLAVGAQQKIVVDIGLAAVSIFAVVVIVLLGASSFHMEKERGILRALLAKPITRVEFILGKYLGTLATAALVIVLMSGLHMLVVLMCGAKVTSTMLWAVYVTILEAGMVTALLTLFSCFTSPVLGSFFTIACVVAGHFSADLLEFARRFSTGFTHGIVTGIYYALPNLGLLSLRSEAVHGLSIPQGMLAAVSLYTLMYVGVLLYAATLIFRAREVS